LPIGCRYFVWLRLCHFGEAFVDWVKKFIVAPGTKVRLSDIDPNFTGKHDNKADALPQIEKNVAAMAKGHSEMYAERVHSLLIVLQGMDTAGKDGAIRHLFSGLNPLGCTVRSFKQPSTEELSHDFLWRVHPHVPPKGEVVIFNRSHYEDVLVARVHKL